MLVWVKVIMLFSIMFNMARVVKIMCYLLVILLKVVISNWIVMVKLVVLEFIERKVIIGVGEFL